MPRPSNQFSSTYPSPAVAFIGRKNSGKTTLVEQVIAHLTEQGLCIASIKHHGHPDFDIDIPGKDSYRHAQAGAQATAILSEDKFAFIQQTPTSKTCTDALEYMPGFDVVIVEGFRQAGLPSIELFRADNPRDAQAAPAMLKTLKSTYEQPGNQQFIPAKKQDEEQALNTSPDYPALPAALITDMPQLAKAAQVIQLPVFNPNDIPAISTFVQERFVREPLSIVIQAGGESKRMGQSKALVNFLGRSLIEHILSLLAPYAAELIVTTNETERLEYLHETWPHIRLVPDVCAERGSLPGLLTAFSAATLPTCAVVACDMIAIPPTLLVHESFYLKAHNADAVIPYHQGIWEPFAGVYHTQTCKQALTQALADGIKRLQEFPAYIHCLPFNAERFHTPTHLNPFINVNTPTELNEARTIYPFYRQ